VILSLLFIMAIPLSIYAIPTPLSDLILISSSFCIAPGYLKLLPEGSQPTHDTEEFLILVAKRLGLILPGAKPDLARAANRFVDWWRDEGPFQTYLLAMHARIF
jgi:ribosome biogenesis GTPase A